MHQLGGDLYVKKATVEFHASACMDDQIDVGMKCARIGNSSMTFSGAIFRGDELLITCELIYVFADPATQTSRPVPLALRDMLLGYEAGEPMVTLATGGWETLGGDASRVRTEVFVRGTAHPPGHGMGRGRPDGACMRWRTTGWASRWQPAGCCSTARARVALAAWRCAACCAVQTWGGMCCRPWCTRPASAGDSEVMLHAQRSAEGFYDRLGFRPRGEPFEEAGIPHIEMFTELTSTVEVRRP
jgi:hypothetical protein